MKIFKLTSILFIILSLFFTNYALTEMNYPRHSPRRYETEIIERKEIMEKYKYLVLFPLGVSGVLFFIGKKFYK